MKVLAITQARIGSSRLPEKVLLNVGKDSLLGLHLKRLSKAKKLNKIIVATTHEVGSDKICEIAAAHSIACFKGSLEDVLDRFYQAAIDENPDYIVRITSDCPLLDPELVDKVVTKAIDGNFDYFSNILTEDFPDGQDIEVFKMSTLKTAWEKAGKKSEREHVTPFIRENSDYNRGSLFKAGDYKSQENFNHIRMTVDELPDLEVIKWLVAELGDDRKWEEYVDYMISNPSKLKNIGIIRNEGYLKSIKKD